jgi:hypothetical protein
LPVGVTPDVVITPVVVPPVVRIGAPFSLALLSENPFTKRDIYSP